jgi:ATP-dependent exoDNAse (exonuclease V) beta subunit
MENRGDFFKCYEGEKGWKELSFGERSPVRRETVTKELPESRLIISPKYLSTSEWQNEFLVFSRSHRLTDQEKRAVDRGDAVHRVLAKLKNFSSEKEMFRQIEWECAGENLAEEEILGLIQFLGRKDVAPYFIGDFTVHTEKEITGDSEDGMAVYRIDRLVILKSEVVVIDYKTGQEKRKEDRLQICRYETLLGPLFPGRHLTKLLYYLDLDEVEEVKC